MKHKPLQSCTIVLLPELLATEDDADILPLEDDEDAEGLNADMVALLSSLGASAAAQAGPSTGIQLPAQVRALSDASELKEHAGRTSSSESRD